MCNVVICCNQPSTAVREVCRLVYLRVSSLCIPSLGGSEMDACKKSNCCDFFHLPPKVKAKAAKKTMELGKGLWGVPGFLPIPQCGISLNLFFLGRYKNNCTQNVARQRDTKCSWPFVCSFFYYSIMHYQEYRVGLCPYRH